jgi:RNA polymerase sigma factor (sigma-70 family)
VNGQHVPVSKEVYLTYYRSKRRERYFERDIKTETPVRDKTGAVVGYRPSHEDSIDRMVAAGEDFIDAAIDVAAEAVSAMMSDRLHEALVMLPDAERELIDALFFSNDGEGMTEREYAAEAGVHHMTVHSRKARILGKLKKLLES